MKSFDQVMPATQRRWLRELGYAALARYGLEGAKLRFLSESSATIFRVDTSQDRFVLRINPELAERWITWTEAELLWLRAIKRDTDLTVPEPVAALNGTLVQRVSTNQIPAGRVVTLLRWTPGQKIGKRPAPDLVRQIGAFMAHLHDHTEHFALPAAIDRPHTAWDKLLYWQDSQNDTSATLTAEQRDLCARASARLLAEIKEIGTAEHYGLVHADLTLNNCLLHQGQLNVIDFADARYASHYYDIAVPLTDLTDYWQPDQQVLQRLQAAFYDGYSRIRPLGSCYESAVKTFMVARAFDVVEWIHLDWPSPTHFAFGPEL
ncbi:MAG: phosphotransferase, partial [Anaerolineales bacterium]|nr:phosphotransferase [Anaerolineales bacterium]